jgi:hypothetical protein
VVLIRQEAPIIVGRVEVLNWEEIEEVEKEIDRQVE